jgi:hypothetical protein
MELCINSKQLRAALAEIEAAEKNGFMHCLAVFKMASAGPNISDCTANYSDLLERAHLTRGDMDWGRFQGVSRCNKFSAKTGKLTPLRGANNPVRGEAKPRSL